MIKRVEAGKSTPAWDNKPELYDDLLPVWSSFLHLHSRRIETVHEDGKIEGKPISVEDIRAWLDIYSIKDPDMKIKYYELITALDSSWRRWKKPDAPKKEENLDAYSTSSDRCT